MKKNIIILTIQLFALLCLMSGCGNNEESILLSESMGAKQEESRQEDAGKSGEEADITKEREKEQIYVQVSGAVAKPGVYALDEGSRIFQAIELAGGVTESADTGSLNQAEVLSDGQMVYIMETGEEEREDSLPLAEQDDGKVNLNTATESELMTLPGIGEAKARSILAWREANGSFTQIEDLMKVEGIKDGVFSKIKDSVKVR